MAVNRVEQAKAQAEAKGAENTAAAGAAAAAAPAKGGLGPWIPLIANVVLMPVVAWAVATFVIVPKIRSSPAKTTAAEATKAESSSPEEGHAKEGAPNGKILAPLSEKILVNLAGSLGTRYLVAKMTLVGRSSDFKDLVEKNDAQLRDSAASALATKTIADLERPDSRNIIRSELMTVFNEILGKGAVSEIFLTEFAIQ